MLNYNKIINNKLYNNFISKKYKNCEKYKDENIISYNNIIEILNIDLCTKDINYKNIFNFYPDFYRKMNNLNIYNNIDLLKHYIDIGCLQSFICNPKQIYKWYPNSYITHNNIRINNNIYNYNDFFNSFIYNKNFNDFLTKNHIIKEIINDNHLLILLHIGNYSNGLMLLKKLLNNYNFILAINIIDEIINDKKNKLINFIEKNFNNFIIFNNRNLGNDIIPSLMMYKYIKNKVNFKYVLKIHTKSKYYNYNILNNIKDKIKIFNSNKNIGIIANSENVYEKDKYNEELINHIYNNSNYHFIAGTIFYINKLILDKIFNYKNIIKAACLMSFYFNNKIFSNSPIHSLERIITMECEKNNYYIYKI